MHKFKSFLLALGLALTPALPALAQAPAPAAPVAAPVAAVPTPAAPVTAVSTAAKADEAAKPAETTIGTSAPVHGIGQPVPGSEAIGLQPQVTELGRRAAFIHDWILMPIMVAISLFVLLLLGWAMAVYRKKANPVPSKTTHNTLIEVLWTLIPVLILVGIAVPSISLLAAQFKPAPADAVTLKATGAQWYWIHNYPDLGVEVTSNLLPEKDAVKEGDRFRTERDGPRLLAVDNRIVLPVNTPIRLLTTANDVIHAWAIPAFWIKMDAVPGRINETSFTVDKTGVYFGQCSELCGIKHGYMPIAVEVVSKEDFATWIRAKGGKMPGDEAAAAAAAPAAAAK
jgi:cytochrome c oxidase subunit II